MTSTDEWLRIESLDLEAQGVAHNAEGKVVFVEDALAGEEVQVAVRRRKNNWEQARWWRCAAERAAGRAALPALRRLRRLHDAAPARRRAGGDQAARARGRALAPRQGPARAGAAADRRAGLGLPAAGAALGASRREEGHGAGRLPRAQVELRRRHPQLRRPAAARQRPAAAAARAGRRDASARPPAADRAGGRRHDHGAGAAPPRAAARGGSGAAARASRRRTASSGGCSPRGRTPRTRSTARASALAYSLPEFGIRMPFRPTDFTQVNHDINRVAGRRAPCACSRPSPTTG